MRMKGWIALDIDGTITLERYSVPEEVVAYLRSLSTQGWQIALATGRPFTFASYALSQFDFPYIFLAQNGSLALEMPEKKELFKRYLTDQAIPLVEKAYEGCEADFVIYAGYEKGDFGYFRPERFSPEYLEYLEEIQKRQKEPWQAVKQFEISSFPLIKCFGGTVQLRKVQERLVATHLFQIAMIRDPFVKDTSMLLVTDKRASKGLALQELFRQKGRGSRVVAAGDDENDISLLKAADIKIAMPHAPERLRKLADFIAPPTRERGILHALQIATEHD